MLTKDVTEWADKIDSAKERNAINDMSIIAYQLLTKLAEAEAKK
jgi:hypothetical protein